MNEYQQIVLLKLAVPIIVLLVIAIVYFVANKNQTIWQRILASSHSIIAIVGAFYAMIACKYTAPNSFDPHTLNFSRILAIAVIFGFVTIFYFKGNKKTHLLLLPFVLCVAYIWHFGGQGITHTLVT